MKVHVLASVIACECDCVQGLLHASLSGCI